MIQNASALTRPLDIFQALPNNEAIPSRWDQLFAGANFEMVRRFIEYHKKNPRLFDLFYKFAKDAKNAGRKRFSGWMLINRIRWYTDIETSGKTFKIANDYIGLYVRLLIYYYPEFEGFFVMREMKINRKQPIE